MSKKAPIALFAYKRPLHLKKTLESLSNCAGASESELFIFCDGARKESDVMGVNEARNIAKSRQWCGINHVIERDRNLGLARSVITGVTELCEKYGRVIVMEDDLLVSKHFLSYLNSALDRYEDDERVMQIAGHIFPIKVKAGTDAIFMPFTTSLGWATWQRAWACFDAGMKGLEKLRQDPVLRRRFDLDGSYPYFKMCESQKDGKVDSWAIRWYMSVFMQNGLTLFPARTLLHNIGFDDSATHSVNKSDEEFYNGKDELTDFQVLRFPPEVKVSEEDYSEMKKFLGQKSPNLSGRLKGVFSTLINRFT